jgi:hypothetical protein
MSILKVVTSNEGVTLGYHKIVKIETVSRPNVLCYIIHSWQNETDYIENRPAVTVLRDEIDAPSDLIEAINDLVLTGTVLNEGTFIADSKDTIEGVKQRKFNEMKRLRDTEINGGFTWDGSNFDSDPISQTRILGAFVAAQEQTWRLSDNTWRVLSMTDIQAVWAALQTHMKANFIKFAIHEAEIVAAVDIETVNAISW